MSTKIILKKNIKNVSLQVGDDAYFLTPDSSGYNDFSTATFAGKIIDIGSNFIITDQSITPSQNDFLMFSKNKAVNDSSLLGYYAEVELSNNSSDKIELYSIGSEVTQSSK